MFLSEEYLQYLCTYRQGLRMVGGKENARNICGVDTSSSKRSSERARRFGSLVLDTTGIYAELVVCRDTRT